MTLYFGCKPLLDVFYNYFILVSALIFLLMLFFAEALHFNPVQTCEFFHL